MNVSSAIEIYSLVMGWIMYDRIWHVLADTGLVYVPLIGAIWQNFNAAYRQLGKDGAEASIRNNWLDISIMMTVMALAGSPLISIRASDITTQTRCDYVPGVAAGKNTGTLYDQSFAAIGNVTAEVPLWWYGLLKLSNGFNSAVIASIPCSPDLRTLSYKLNNTRIQDPELRRQLELFTADCWLKARAKFFAAHATLPGNFQSGDIDWIGSQYFLTTDGYYTNANLNLSIRASEEIPGYPYNAARDTEYSPGFIPVWGRPQCGEWWSDPNSGILARVMGLLDNELWTQAIIDTGTFDAAKAKSDLVRALLNPEAANFGRMITIGSYASPYSTPTNTMTNLFGAGVATYGAAREAIDWLPKIYALRQAAPIGQALILLGVYMFLPLVLFFSGFSGSTMITVSTGIFGIKFLTPIWAMAVWLDNHLMTGLGISWSQTLSSMDVDRMATVTVLNLMAVLLFGILPMVWFAVIGWAGIHINNMIPSLNKLNGPIEASANRGTSASKSAARNAYKKYSNYKKSQKQ